MLPPLAVNVPLGLTLYCWAVRCSGAQCAPRAALLAACPVKGLGSDTAAIEMRSSRSRPARLFVSAAILAAVAAVAAGCQTTQTTATTGALALTPPDDRPAAEWRRQLVAYDQQYRNDPSNVDVALHYAQALRATGERAQALAVLQRLSIKNPYNKPVLAEYGRALAENGDYEQAFDVLSRAHTPDQPNWRILSAQGAVLDQMGRHAEAQRYYRTALKIVPNEPSVLSNLGLSYALTHNLPDAEKVLRQAAEQNPVDPRVRQNLALVVGLQGRFAEAEAIARAELPPDQAAANVAYLRQMLARPDLQKKKAGASPLRQRAELTPRCYRSAITRMAAGPRMTTNSTGRKNTIIGTVNFGGRPAAFFSASDMRRSRFSCAITRKRRAERRAVAFRLLQREAHGAHTFNAGALSQILVGRASIGQI